MLALIDMNAFYASCEIAFKPSLYGKPIVVLSNNDGCAISRTAEAKALGVKMGQPAFELRDLVRRQGLIMLSSNYALYGDMSKRVQTILMDLFPKVEIYSIDECFLDLDGVMDAPALCNEARERILRWTGIPCCVGIAPTKTLAKAANRWAKKTVPVVDLSDPGFRDKVLEQTPADGIWGIGRRLSKRLQDFNIATAKDVRDAPAPLLRSNFGVVVERIKRELQGIQCAELEVSEPDRKEIFCTRSFGHLVDSLDEMREAIAAHTVRAAEKMRSRELRAGGLHVFMHTSPFRGGPQYSGALTTTLPHVTVDSRLLLHFARTMTNVIWREGFQYIKAGIGLLDLSRSDARQTELFESDSKRDETLMATIDKINKKFGNGLARFGSQGASSVHSWKMRQESVSPHYTTRWTDLVKAH